MLRFYNPFKKKVRTKSIEFDEVLLDAVNLASMDRDQMEGRLEMAVKKRGLYMVGVVFFSIASIYIYRLYTMQIINGTTYAERSEQNMLGSSVIVAERGVIYDVRKELVAWNEDCPYEGCDYPLRAYTKRRGLGQLIGYVKTPRKDESGKYYRTEYVGQGGVEESENVRLAGQNGERLVEENAKGETVSQYATKAALSGVPLTLSIDSELTEAMYDIIASSTITQGFQSGAGAIMDVETGDILAMTSYPSYDPKLFADGTDVEAITSLINDKRAPLMNKIIAGGYIPGSVVKPFVAYAALAEEVISPGTAIYSDGKLTVPNKYDPDHPSIFRDWKAHGYTDMRRAIAVSGDVYFYTIGGGTDEQKGLGITKLHSYMKLFGFEEKTGIRLGGEIKGTVPDPDWKQKTFNDDWRLGDTYYTAIGQYGWRITPIQMLRAYAVIANGGKLITPKIMHMDPVEAKDLHLNMDKLQIVRDGMRMAVREDGGTVRGLDRADVAIAAKSGTAELDKAKTKVNTWVAGYFPYEKPKYAFILFMEDGPYSNQLGAGKIMGRVFDWMAENRPELFK